MHLIPWTHHRGDEQLQQINVDVDLVWQVVEVLSSLDETLMIFITRHLSAEAMERLYIKMYTVVITECCHLTQTPFPSERRE
jgi:hypothetical protein